MNYIIIYLEMEHLLNFLTQEEKGDFLDLLISYGKNQELPKIENKKLLNVFNFMKGRLDTQFEKAKLKAETAKKNGASGGRPIKDIKPSNNPTKPKDNPDKPKKTQSVFIKPTIQEIKDYCLERKNNVDVNKFFNYYEANGWKVGKNAMKDWKACVRTWEGNGFNSNFTQKPTGMPKPRYDDPDYYKNDGGWND
jgi:hypothetical protein